LKSSFMFHTRRDSKSAGRVRSRILDCSAQGMATRLSSIGDSVWGSKARSRNRYS
jgi:hypothetical protein